MFLSATLFAWGVTSSADAAITNTATATANAGVQVITATATESVDVEDLIPAITMDKSAIINEGGDGSADVGDTITYTFIIKNTGNVTLNGVAITDALASPGNEIQFADDLAPFISTDAGMNGIWDALAHGETIRMTASYALTPADLTNGSVTNTATVNATTPTVGPASATDSVTLFLNVDAALTLDKVATLQDGGDGVNAGDTIDYTFTVTNTGNSTLTNVSVSDPLVAMASLPAQEKMIALFDTAKTDTDPIATASIDPFDPVAAFEGAIRIYAPNAVAKIALYQAEQDIPQLPTVLNVARKMVLMSGDPLRLVAGDQVGIYFDLINAGEGPITNISVTQEGAEAFGGSLDILPANTRDNASIIFTRTLSEEDISNGMIADAAVVTYKSRGQTFTGEAIDVLPLGDMANLQELATASITPVSVATLAVGDSAVFTATLVLTQAHIDAGVVNNSALAEGFDPNNNQVTAPGSASTPLTIAADIAVLKVGTLDLGTDSAVTIGDVITYEFEVRNTGNVTLTGITLSDPLPGIVLAGGPIATLAPGASDTTTFTATYAITQDDVDAGEVGNQALVRGSLPDNSTIEDLSDEADEDADAETIVELVATPKLSLLKTVPALPASPFIDSNSNGLPDAGEVMIFTMTATNTGNVSLNNVHVVDRNPLVNVTPAPPTGLTVAPGGNAVFTGIYILTQADIDQGFIENTADAKGMDQNNVEIIDESHPTDLEANGPTRIDLIRQPGIALIKRQSGSTDVNSNGDLDEGDRITYEFDVINTGNVTLTNVVITDPNADSGSIIGTLATLEPGATVSNAFTAFHTISLGDMTVGEVVNQATVTAQAPDGADVTDLSDASDPAENDPTVTALTPQPAIAVKKIAAGIADTNTNGVTDVGDTVNYTFEVKNTGNVTLTNVNVIDLVSGVTMAGNALSTLDAGETDLTNFTASYVLQTQDITAGTFNNRAQASGTAPDTTVVVDQSDDASFEDDGDTIVTIGGQPSIALIKRVVRIEDVNKNKLDDAGDKIHYAFTVINTGNIDLFAVKVTDAKATVTGGPLATLAAGISDATTFTAIHVLTQAELNAGTFENQATVKANGPTPVGGTPIKVTDKSDDIDIDGDDPTITALEQKPKIAVVKTIKSVTDNNGNGLTDIGDIVNYAFAVHNTGNVTLTNVTITDPNGVMKGGPLATLQPGKSDSKTFTATHIVTNADAEAEQVVNQATGSGQSPSGVAVTDLSDDSSPSGGDPTIIKVAAPKPVLTKVAAKSEVRRGERLGYTITASNLRTGPYDLTDIMPPGFDYVGGSATINGVGQTPVEVGNVLTFANITPNAEGKVILKLQLLTSTTVATGKFINRAQLIFSSNGQVLTTAQAAAVIKEEHVFDCGEIIGRVFDDKNGNGYQDKGELGLAGVRLATVNGLLITTDKNGLFHISCADIPNAQIGSNFLLKLDVRTLPKGYKLTTENPRDVRLTRGKITKLNFGASKNTDIELELKRDAFSGGISLFPQWADGLDRLVSLLEQGRGSLSIVYRCGQYAPIADERVAAVRDLVERRWADAGHNQRLIITTRVECGK